MKRPLLLVALCSPLAIAATSCAQGTALEGGGGGSTETTGAAGGTDTTTSSSGGAGPASSASSTAMSSTSSGLPCSESPCKLVDPQCGCPADNQCSVNAGGPFCKPAGSVPWGEVCGAGMECEPGDLCVLTKDEVPTISTCSKFCDDDLQCEAPGGLCIITLNDGMGGAIPGVTLCTPNCSPTNNSGCVAGTSCQLGTETMGLMRTVSFCTGAGSGTQGIACTDAAGCAPTFGCFDLNGNKECLKWCTVGGGGCAAPATCQGLNPALTLGVNTYGVCL